MTEPTELPIDDAVTDTDGQEVDQLAVLKARAQRLGIKFHPSIGLDSLRTKVNEALTGEVSEASAVETSVEAKAESKHELRNRLSAEAGKLVRIRITCMNPNKKDWRGEVFTASNSLVGTFRKYVPFNNDEGWHVPQIILEMIKERKFQTFYTEKDKRGVAVRKGKLVPEFAIEIMPDLTKAELDELARRQAMAGTVN